MKSFSRIGAGLLVLCLALCLLPLTAKAENGVVGGACGDNLTWSFDPATGTLTIDGSGAMTDYITKDSWGDDMKLDTPWEEYLLQIKTIIIGQDVTYLGKFAFRDCRYVTAVQFNAKNMQDLERPNYAFQYTGELGEGVTITIGAEVTRIPANLFAAYVVGDNIKTASVQFASGSVCTEIGDYAFYWISQLTSIEGIPDCLQRIGKRAFSNCRGISEIYLPDTMTEIGEGAFTNTALTEVTVPSGVTVIREDAFNYCTKLESVTLHDNVTEIGDDAFYNTALTEINYPANVETVGKNLFGTAPLEIVRVYSPELVKQLNASTGYNIAPYSVPQVWIKKTLSANITDWLADRYDYMCVQQYKGEDFIVFSNEFIAAHTHLMATVWSSDDSGHWYACYGCDEKTDFEAHRYTDACDAECNTCGYIRTVTHSYSDTWSTNSEKHWHQCSVCGNKTDESAHIPGAAATESAAQTCTTCGYVLQAPLGHEHSFSSAWQTDAFSHWRVCACGAKTDEGSHNWDGGTVTQQPQAGQTGTRVYTCAACGTQKSENIDALPPETGSEPAPTEPAPNAPAPTEPAPTEPAPTETTPLMLRIVKSPWTWCICGGIILLTIVLTIFLTMEKKLPKE